MIELVNISNHDVDKAMLRNGSGLENFLGRHRLHGIELMLCAPVTENEFPSQYVQGAHLRFWPNWLDFWRKNKAALLTEFGSMESVQSIFGGLRQEDWLELYRKNIEDSIAAGAQYVVFHVSQARQSEIYRRSFFYRSDEVVKATIEVINELADCLPEHVTLLFENLWWPGLTMKDKALAEALLAGVRHKNTGFMLDTGHLMNTNLTLKTQAEGVDYIMRTLDDLGSCRERIYGMHLHQSLSGTFVKECMRLPGAELMTPYQYILATDQHEPFSDTAVQRLVEAVRPQVLVHEFMQSSMTDWAEKVTRQRKALGYEK